MFHLVLVLIHLYLHNGHSAQHEVIHGVGIKLCKLKCNQRGSCMSIAYDADRLECHLSHKDPSNWEMGRFVNFPQITDQISADTCSLLNCKPNTRCVVRRRGGAVCVEDHTVDSILEMRCTRPSDCPEARKFVCFNKTCKCVPGYSFNPASNSCVRRCNKYGDGFTTYPGLGIKGHNDETGHDKTLKECIEMCVRMKKFTCLTVDFLFIGRGCQVSKSGYRDVSMFYREKGMPGWGLAVRNCA